MQNGPNGVGALADLHAIVPAGGAGTRLWPLSRAQHPKFLLDLTGSGRSLLQSTWDRLEPLVGRDRVHVVTGAGHAGAVVGQLPDLPVAQLVAEPTPRDSMAAIGLAAAIVAAADPDALVGSFAADHVITDQSAFADALVEAAVVARTGDLVTIGIAPTFPSTAFGYVRLGEAMHLSGAPSARRVRSFREKPDAATARSYLASGDYRWNGGMFVCRAHVLLDLLGDHHPALRDALVVVAGVWDRPERDAVLAATWPSLERISIDHAVAEPAAAAGRVAVVPALFGWDDIGDWASLSGLLDDRGDQPVVVGDAVQVLAQDSRGGLVVPAGGRLVAVLGLDDVVVVDTPDAVLVTSRARAQDVRAVVARLVETGRADLT